MMMPFSENITEVGAGNFDQAQFFPAILELSAEEEDALLFIDVRRR